MQAAADHKGVSLTTVSKTEQGIKPNHEFAAAYRSWLDTLTLARVARGASRAA